MDLDLDRVAAALGDLSSSYWTPIVYPWSVQHFEVRTSAERPRPRRRGLRIYAHIPFCRYHCTFCMYAVRAGARRAEMERYVAALARELLAVEPGTSLSKLIVGGGTPTALPPELLDAALAPIVERTERGPGCLSKIEASPDSLTDEHLEVLQRRGFGWVSVGVESTSDEVLATVHRNHSNQQALEALRRVKRAGLKLNADLIYGLPGQSMEAFRRDLAAVSEAGVDSVCLYALRLNEKTRIARQLAAEERLDLERVVRWRAFATRAAAEAGFTRKRPYTWTRAGAPSGQPRRETGDEASEGVEEYALGMSARSQVGGAVYRNHERIGTYLERIEAGRSPVESVFDLDEEDRRMQFVAGTLGNGKPLDRAAYAARTGGSVDAHFGEVLGRLRAAGLLDDDGARVRLTDAGFLVYDRLLQCFYPPRAQRWLREMTAGTVEAGAAG